MPPQLENDRSGFLDLTDEATEDFLAFQDQLSGCVAAAEGLDLRCPRLPSPTIPLLRISLGTGFEAPSPTSDGPSTRLVGS